MKGLLVTEAELWELAERVMTPAQWLAFYLRFGEEMPVVKIAQALKISRQAVDARIAEARKNLGRAIEALEEAA